MWAERSEAGIKTSLACLFLHLFCLLEIETEDMENTKKLKPVENPITPTAGCNVYTQ
jgi:hypothetical protein